MHPELESYLNRIHDLRGQVGALVAGLPAEALNWRPLEGIEEHATNSLAVLATHVAGAEHFWISEVVGRRPPTRDRDAEFVTTATDAHDLIQRLESVGTGTQAVFSSMAGTDLEGTREARGRIIPVRWCILHVIDHTSLHLGHMQLTYQLWRGGQTGPSPRWFDRVKTGD
jgi:uncharacterized damage-inducible protein DinB